MNVLFAKHIYMKKIILISIFLVSSLIANAQWVLINDGGGDPVGSAALEINSTDRGLLIPRMTLAQRLAIAFPSEGLLVYQNDATKGFYFHDGTQWVVLEGGVVNNITNVNNSKIAVVRDVKASGVNGGTFTAGTWQTRDLNDLRGDSSFITINEATTFTLDSGLYEISASAPARNVNQHQIRLYNFTDATVEATGTAMMYASATPESRLLTVIKINAQKTFRIEHRFTITNAATDARGTGIGWGENVYTQVRIQQF